MCPLGGSTRAMRQCCADERGSLGWRGRNSELQVPRRGCCSRCFFPWELLRACLQLQRLLMWLDSSPERLCLQKTPKELEMVTAYKRDLKGCGGCCASAEPRDPCAAFKTKGKKGQSKRQVHQRSSRRNSTNKGVCNAVPGICLGSYGFKTSFGIDEGSLFFPLHRAFGHAATLKEEIPRTGCCLS